jgi:hypothetical protein
MRLSLSLLSIGCGLVAFSGAALAQSAETTRPCTSSCSSCSSSGVSSVGSSGTLSVAVTEARAQCCPSSACCANSKAMLSAAPRATRGATPLAVASAAPRAVAGPLVCTASTAQDETIGVRELVRRIQDPAQREAVLDALRAHRLRIDDPEVRAQAESAVHSAQKELESACRQAASMAADSKKLSEEINRQVQQELDAALAGLQSAQVGDIAAEATRAAELATQSTLESIAKHRSHEPAARQDPEAADDDHDADDGDDNDMDDEGDETTMILGTPGFVWNAPEAMEPESAEELARLPDQMKALADSLRPLADSDADDVAPQDKPKKDQTLAERVRELERLAHGDAQSDDAQDGRSLEERVSDLEKLMHDRMRSRNRTPPRAQSGQGGKYHIVTPGQDGWGVWTTPRTPHVAPVQPTPPTPPSPATPGAPAFPRLPAPPSAPEAPRTIIRVPGEHGEGYEIYKSTPGPDGKWELAVPKLDHLNGMEVSPEAREKIKRGMEKAQRAVEQARSQEARALEESKAARARLGSMNAQGKKEVEALMRDMRRQMDQMRAEMNRLKAELERMPRNETR